MPATERLFTETPSSRLYLDNDFIINGLIAGQPHHDRTTRFVVRLAEVGMTTLYVSSLVWLEFIHVVCRNDFRAALPPDEAERFSLANWNNAQVRKNYHAHMLGLLDQFLSQFEVIEVPLGPEIRETACDYVSRFNLGANDAAHLASAISAGVLDLASYDAKFRRVDDLFLWNDRIYG